MFDFIVDVEQQEYLVFVNDHGNLVAHAVYEYEEIELEEMEVELWFLSKATTSTHASNKP